MTEKNIRPDRTKQTKRTLSKDVSHMHRRYNMDMTYDAEVLKLNFGSRLAELRMKRNVSAREMSISMGHGAGYINSIENGHTLPSMVMLFEICEYLDVSPKEFFEFTDREPDKLFELRLAETYRGLGNDEKEMLRRIIELLKRKV